MVLLVGINAKYIHSNLGIYCIQAYARKKGILKKDFEIKEYTINQDIDFILGDIYLQKPEMIGFSCYIWNIDFVVKITKELHKIMPDIPIWLGGPEVSYDSDIQLKKYSWIKGIISGEGEVTFYQLLNYYLSEENAERRSFGENITDLSDINGIVYRECENILSCDLNKLNKDVVKSDTKPLSDNEKICVNQNRPIMTMDEVPFPYTNDAGFDMESLKNRIIYYETSRGCPYGCSYCLSSVDKNVRFRSISLVEKELQFFIDLKVPQVKFVDRTFNCNHEHTMAIWKYIYEHDNGITNFHFELSAELLTDEEIEYVKSFRPGLVQFEIGVQTANPETLRQIHRNPDLTLLKEKVAKIREKRNIHQHLDLIAGLPYEDFESFRDSYNEVYSMKPDQLQLGFLKVLKGSPIYYDRDKFGIVYQERAPYEVLFTKWISYSDLLRLKRVEDMTERYYNSMQFEATLPYIISFFETPFDFFMQLGEYYKKMGYSGVHQSRLQNYEILLEFAINECELADDEREVFEQLMLYDIYARENLKNRPKFIKWQSEIAKDEVRAFYMEEEQKHKYLSGYEENDWKQLHRMTHLQQFDIDISEYLKNGKIINKKSRLLFDYKNRNPLDYQAGVYNLRF